ncbi:hypothetical protein SteCoe_27371 [Stentor coeruleus]|uniref:Cullin family profile domain-containing protein n=1 Tax=Stentor coeruleus TaxID=5963 RepID=A0A1R2BB00_9CILI|nr:hypothetical protein SteCoe_27371 [Stentor coeruleus]
MSKKGNGIPYVKIAMPVPKEQAIETWKSLDHSIGLIFDFQASKLSFEELYRKAYDLVIHKYSDLLYNGLTDSFHRQCSIILSKLRSEFSGNLFEVFFQSWTNFKMFINMIKDILMYMDRNYVLSKNLLPVYELGLSIFKSDIILDSDISMKTRTWILENIKNDRNMQMMSTEKCLIKNIINMLAEINPREKSIYVSIFENPFIEESRVFFTYEAQEWVSSDSCPEYLKKVERRLKEEQERVEQMMDPRTENLILKVVDDCFIKAHARTLVNMEGSGCTKMMDNLQLDDLKRMYWLFSRVPECRKEISSHLSSSIEAEGAKIISLADYKKNYKQLMDDLLKIREKYELIVTKSFDRDPIMQTSMNLSFEKCINKNPKTALALTLYINNLLTKGIKSMNESQIETIFDQAILIFRYISDKDIFETYYKQNLSKRLLSSSSLSDDAERLMIRKLKIECGSHYTSKIEGMLIDMRLSKDSLKDFINPNDVIEFKVLTAAFWPQAQVQPIILPVEFSTKIERFRRLYLNKYSGRTLIWTTNVGNAEIKAYLGESREKHDLVVSTYQMAILLMYNDKVTYSYNEICEGLNTDDKEFEFHVLGLVKCGILVKRSNEKKLEKDTVLMLNENFKHKMYKIKVPILQQKENTDDICENEIPEVVEDDRKHMIEAIIVKVMKSRRTIGHQQLIGEVSKMVAWKFVANNKQIKGRIENLIEREFLQRDPKDSNVYLYIV